MFFLIPMIAGAAATAISAGEVALGLTAAVGIGAAVKNSIDSNQANEIRRLSEAKIDDEVSKLNNEKNKMLQKFDEANRIKQEINSGILNESSQLINSYGNRRLLEAERFAEDVNIECENIENKIAEYKILRKQIGDGIKIMTFLSKELSCCLKKANEEQFVENSHPDKNLNTHFDQIVVFTEALKKAMSAAPSDKESIARCRRLLNTNEEEL